MMGIISLAGIVVNNGVVLLDYTQLLIDRKKIAYDLRREELLKARQRTRDSIKAVRSGQPWPPIPPKENDQNQEATPPQQNNGSGR